MHISNNMPLILCTVCKIENSKGPYIRGKNSWVLTSDRTSISQVQIIFRLYEILKLEFLPGSLCDECFGLLEQIDSLEFQVQTVRKALRSRVDNGVGGEYEETFADENGDNEEKHFAPSTILTESQNGKNHARKWGTKSRLKRRRRHSRRDSSSGDNSPDDTIIDVNQFLAQDNDVRIKEEQKQFDDELRGSCQTSAENSRDQFWEMVCDPKVIEKALHTENIDYNVTLAQTTRGQEQLVYEGYTYKKYSYQDKQERVLKWKCSNYYAKKGKCPAKIATTADASCVLLDSKMIHNHEPDPSAIKIIMFRDRVKDMAVNHPDMKASEILANVEMLMENPGPLGLKDESLLRYVQRVRSKQARGEMGCKKVASYNRKKGYKWGVISNQPPMAFDHKDKDESPEKNDFPDLSSFQSTFLRNEEDGKEISENRNDVAHQDSFLDSS